MAKLTKPHRQLHDTAVSIAAALAAGSRVRAEQIFNRQTLPALAKVAASLNRAIAAEKVLIPGREQANKVTAIKPSRSWPKPAGCFRSSRPGPRRP